MRGWDVGRKVDEAESEAVLLRTSADVASHALTQIDCMVEKWPEFYEDSQVYRRFVERVVVRAKEYGYVEKRGRA